MAEEEKRFMVELTDSEAATLRHLLDQATVKGVGNMAITLGLYQRLMPGHGLSVPGRDEKMEELVKVREAAAAGPAGEVDTKSVK